MGHGEAYILIQIIEIPLIILKRREKHPKIKKLKHLISDYEL